MDEQLQQLVIQIPKFPPRSEERQKAIVTLVDNLLRSSSLFRFSRNKSLCGVYLDVYQALQQQLHQDIVQTIDECKPQDLTTVWIKEVRARTFIKVLNEVFLQQLANSVLAYQPQTKEWQFAFQILTNAILLSDKLLHKAHIYDDVYEDAKNELWIWLYRNLNTYNPSKGRFIAWLNFRFDMILRSSQTTKYDPFVQKLNAKIIRTKYQLANFIKSINKNEVEFWFKIKFQKLLPDILVTKILLLFILIFILSQSTLNKSLDINLILFEIARQSLPTLPKLTEAGEEVENIPQPESEPILSEQLRQYLQTDPNQLLQKHIRANPEATFQVIALQRLEGKSWKELSDTFNIGIPALSNFFQRHLQKIAPEIKKYIQQ